MRVIPAYNGFEHHPTRLFLRAKVAPIEQLAVQRGEEALTHRIAVAVSNWLHRWPDNLFTPAEQLHSQNPASLNGVFWPRFLDWATEFLYPTIRIESSREDGSPILPLTPPDMRVRIRRFVEECALGGGSAR